MQKSPDSAFTQSADEPRPGEALRNDSKGPTRPLPTLAAVKALGRERRALLEAQGTKIGHAKALEMIAHEYGYRDWNTFSAAINAGTLSGWEKGGRVGGTYLSQPFAATILDVSKPRPGWFHLTLDLDEAVDVVTFDSFSNFRKRIRGTVGPKGTSRERTSDGQPHLRIDM